MTAPAITTVCRIRHDNPEMAYRLDPRMGNCLAISANGRRVAQFVAVPPERPVRIWDVNEPPELVASIPHQAYGVRELALNNDGRVFAAFNTLGLEVHAIHPNSNYPILQALAGKKRGPASVLASTPTLAIAGSVAPSIPAGFEQQAELSGTGYRGAVVITEDCKTVVTSTRQTVELWPLDVSRTTPWVQMAAALRIHRGARLSVGKLPCIALTPDGRRLAVAMTEKVVRVWDLAIKSEVIQLKHDKPPTALAFSSDGQLLASSVGPSAHVWSVTTGASVFSCRDDVEVYALAFARGGARLVTATVRGVVMWPVHNAAAPVRMPLEHEFPIAFSANAGRLLSFRPDGAGRFFGSGWATVWSVPSSV